MIQRKRITLQQVRELTGEYDTSVGICGIVDVENMGFCKDGTTRWYHFRIDGTAYVYYKY